MKTQGWDNRPPYRWVMLSISFFSFVAYAFALQLAPPLIPSIIEEFNITHAEAGLLMSIVLVPGIFFGLPAGLFAEKYGVRQIGFASLICVILGCFVTAAANSFTMMLAGRLILGLGGSSITPTLPAIIAQWFSPKELGKAMGIYASNLPFATVVAFPSASFLMLAHGWRFPFYVGLAMGITVTVIFLASVKEGSFAGYERKTSLRQAIGNFEIWKIGLVWLFFTAASMSFTTWAPELFETFREMPKVNASFMASLLMWMTIVCAPIYGWISDRTNKRKAFAIVGSFSMTLSFIALVYTSNLALTVSIIALGVTSAMVPPIVFGTPAEILGPSLASVGFGITGICGNIGAALAQPLIGFILDITGSYAFCILGMAALPAFGALSAYTLKTH